MSIVTVMRVKDEELYLAYALESLRAVGGAVVLLDDGSTDRTPDIAQGFDFVDYHRQDNDSPDEGADRTFIYRRAMELDADWVFTLDGDEVLTEKAAEKMVLASEQCPDDVNVFRFHLAVMASHPSAKRKQWLGLIPRLGYWEQDRMFRVRDADTEHEFSSRFESNLHCGCIPPMRDQKIQVLNYGWIEYYGYETPEAVDRKRQFYGEHDPVHMPNLEKMWRSRAECRPIGWGGALDLREHSIRAATY